MTDKQKLKENKKNAQIAFKIGKEFGWAKGNKFMGNFSTIGALLEMIIKNS